MLNRRTFFSGLTSLLAGLPFVGKAFASDKPSIEHEWNPEDGYVHKVTYSMDDICRGYLISKGMEAIRWISVDERLPKRPENWTVNYGPITALVRYNTGFVTRVIFWIGQNSRWEFLDGSDIPEGLVTHWADMPKGPQA